jgi:hypothetical protein
MKNLRVLPLPPRPHRPGLAKNKNIEKNDEEPLENPLWDVIFRVTILFLFRFTSAIVLILSADQELERKTKNRTDK